MPAQDLTYTVKSHHDRRMQVSLLTSISGFFNPGQMSALVRRPACLASSRACSSFWHTPLVRFELIS